MVIVLCAEQGFASTFNERVLDAAERHLNSDAAELLVVGDRGAMVAAERGLAFSWSAPMLVPAVPAPSAAIEIVERALLPFDFTRFKVAPRSIPPITTLPAERRWWS